MTAAVAQTSVYRWVDKDGKVHFSDTPPPQDARSSSQKTLGGGYVDQSQLPYATQVAMKKSPVTLYIGGDCGEPCSEGRELLAKRGVPYTAKNAQTNAADQEALRKLVGALEVPALVVGETVLKGYSEASWNAALDAAGYPRTRAPGQPPAPVKEPEPAPPVAASPAPTAQNKP